MITITFENPINLWSMDNLSFNQWRRENDLPVLFDYFSRNLPYFHDWMVDNHLTLNMLLEVVPTGSLFKGDSKSTFVRYNDRNNISYCKVIDDQMLHIIKLNSNYIIQEERKIVSYILWTQQKLKTKKFIHFQLPNQGLTDTFVYNARETIQLSPGMWSNNYISRVALFGNFQVLKLGSVTLGPLIDLQDRNLDFTDMDDIQIFNNFSASSLDISYSSCCNLRLIDAKVYYFSFFQCCVGNLYCNNSAVQNLSFYKCEFHTLDKFGLKMENSTLTNLDLNKCDIWKIGIDNCEIDGFNYKINDKCNSLFEYDNLRRIRTAFQNKGNRSEASKYYILERIYESKTLLFPYLRDSENKYPRLSNRRSISSLVLDFLNKEIKLKELFKYIFERFIYYFQLFFRPKYVFNYQIGRRKMKYISSAFENIFWGYGEKPSRTLLISFLSILFYSCIYFYNKSELQTIKDYIDSLYFSIVTFSTLGYGDILPQTSGLRLICASEAILGIVCAGMFVAGFANKSKY